MRSPQRHFRMMFQAHLNNCNQARKNTERGKSGYAHPLIIIPKYHLWKGTWDDGAQHLSVIKTMIKVLDGKHDLPNKWESSSPTPPQLGRWGQTFIPEELSCSKSRFLHSPAETGPWCHQAGTCCALRSAWPQMFRTAHGITVKPFTEVRNAGTQFCHRHKVSYKLG